MPYISAQVGRVHMLRWQGPTLADVDAVMAEITAMRRTAGRPLVCIGVIADDMAPPDERTRQAMMTAMQDIVVSSEVVHFIVEGTGFKNSIMRSVLAGILLIGGKRGKVIVHNDIGEAFTALPRDVDTATVRARAEQKGIVRKAK